MRPAATNGGCIRRTVREETPRISPACSRVSVLATGRWASARATACSMSAASSDSESITDRSMFHSPRAGDATWAGASAARGCIGRAESSGNQAGGQFPRVGSTHRLGG